MKAIAGIAGWLALAACGADEIARWIYVLTMANGVDAVIANWLALAAVALMLLVVFAAACGRRAITVTAAVGLVAALVAVEAIKETTPGFSAITMAWPVVALGLLGAGWRTTTSQPLPGLPRQRYWAALTVVALTGMQLALIAVEVEVGAQDLTMLLVLAGGLIYAAAQRQRTGAPSWLPVTLLATVPLLPHQMHEIIQISDGLDTTGRNVLLVTDVLIVVALSSVWAYQRLRDRIPGHA